MLPFANTVDDLDLKTVFNTITLATTSKNPASLPSQILSIVSWFSSVGYVSSLAQSLSAPGEVFWWSYYLTKMECAVQTSSGFFKTITEVKGLNYIVNY